MHRFVVFVKLKKIICGLKGQKLTDTDRRVIRGLFVRQLKDFDEDQRALTK